LLGADWCAARPVRLSFGDKQLNVHGRGQAGRVARLPVQPGNATCVSNVGAIADAIAPSGALRRRDSPGPLERSAPRAGTSVYFRIRMVADGIHVICGQGKGKCAMTVLHIRPSYGRLAVRSTMAPPVIEACRCPISLRRRRHVGDLAKLKGARSSTCIPARAGPARRCRIWDAIPGARGSTPQSCAFRDH